MSTLFSLCLLLALSSCSALFEEEAGQLDFLVATAGHGRTNFVHGFGTFVITSDSPQESGFSTDAEVEETSCYIASRSLDDGSLLWRRNVCSEEASSASASEVQRHVTAVSSDYVITMDHTGIVRAWDAASGSLIWDTLVPSKNPNLWTVTVDSKDYVEVGAGSDRTVLDAVTGAIVTESRPKAKKPTSRENPLESFCSAAELLVSVRKDDNSLLVWRSDNGKAGDALELSSDLKLPEDDHVTSLSALSCDSDIIAVLLSTQRGTTVQMTVLKDGPSSVRAETKWTAEEGLAQVSSALMLDASHYVGDLTEDNEDKLLQLATRLESQWKSITSLLSSESASDKRDHTFGFVKIAVLLSQATDRIFGMDTVGSSRGSVKYQVDLPAKAEWHKLIHGSANAHKGAHGIHGGTHTREVLIVSSVPSSGGKEIHWMCFDGTNGDIHAKGSIAVSSSVAQIAPLAGVGSCRQSAVLVLEDRSVAVIPGDEATKASVQNQIHSASNFYSHVIDRENAGLESLRILTVGNDLVSQSVGYTAFPGERIVSVTYPSREEAVQSPCNVLGDDSLLLKYLNPHMTVIMTMSTSEGDQDQFSSALKRSKTGGPKRKPAGVKQVDVPLVSEDTPNFFVNVVDSVSGRVLYRASHTGAVSTPAPIAVISENWIIYTFQNAKTRRSELGVLSLYEGMIGSDALTAFTSPEQTTSFSSLDARESKPVVLAKTFSISKPATALGMTSTLGGISGRRLIIAGIDNRITAVDRKMLGKWQIHVFDAKTAPLLF
jgi:hypothetical protein